jgi:hypothetical protein
VAIPEIAENELIGSRWRKIGLLKIGTPYPKTFTL